MTIRKRVSESPRTATVRRTSASPRQSNILTDFPNVVPRPGTILVSTRAISARVNKNMDGFPSRELEAAYHTFVGRPVFVNHKNLDHRETRGIVRDASYNEVGRDKYISLCIEVDARAFPRLAAEIEAGRLDGVSMGTDVKHTICSYCENVAQDPYDFCSHILYHKGSTLEKIGEAFQREAVLVYEICEGLNFFEISFVFDPADETALVQEVYVPGGYNSSRQAAGNDLHGLTGRCYECDGFIHADRDNPVGVKGVTWMHDSSSPNCTGLHTLPKPGSIQQKDSRTRVKSNAMREYSVIPKVSYDETVAPSDVNTLRDNQDCPQCHDENFDGERCLWCNYIAPPEELADPDLQKAKEVDLREDIDDSAVREKQQSPDEMMADRTQRAVASRNPFVRRS